MLAARQTEPTRTSRSAQTSEPKTRDELLLLATNRFCDADTHDRLSQKQFQEAFYLLIGEAKSGTKQMMARSLARCTFTPRSIALYFALETLDVAEPMLLRSPVLGQLDFLQIIDVKGAEYAITIANRPDIGPSVIRRLEEFDDRQIGATLKGNPALENVTTKFSADELFEHIHQRHLAEENAAVADPDLTAQDETNLSSAESALMTAAARGGRLNSIENISPPQQTYVNPFEFGAAMEQMAKTKSHQGMAVLMQKRFGISLKTAHQVLADKSGDPLAVILKAADTPPAQANRILMLSQPSVGLSTHNATRAIHLYANLKQSSCQEAVDQWPKQDEAHTKIEHQGYYSESNPVRTVQDRQPATNDLAFEEIGQATG